MQTTGPHREHAPSASPHPAGPGKLPGIKHIIAVTSGKGGHQSDFVVEEMSGRPLLDPKNVRPDVSPRAITSVGNYAITINWNDGHSMAIRTQLLTGVPAILESPYHASTGRRPDTEVRAVVQELLDREVNRSVDGHGGLSIVDLQDGNLFIAMSSGCQGCAASHMTLRQGVEVMMRGVAPEIVDIVDTTDHASGKNPFYERTG